MSKNWSYTIKDENHPHNGKTLWSGRYCAVSAFIFGIFPDGIKILANKRGLGTPDYQGYWNCPCGFVEADETLEQACSREVLEETKYFIHPNAFQFVNIESDPKICNNGNITIRYYAILREIPEITNFEGGEKNEVDEVKWISIDEIESYNWAFNHLTRIKEIYNMINILFKHYGY